MHYKEFKWLCESKYEEIPDGIRIYAPPGSNYFVTPINDNIDATAPFFYQEVTGDFIFRAKINLDFVSAYDAGVLLALGNEIWMQLARKGDISAIHYSLDGNAYQMARLTYLPMNQTIVLPSCIVFAKSFTFCQKVRVLPRGIIFLITTWQNPL